MGVWRDAVVAADSTEPKQRPTFSLCNGVQAAQNIALRAYWDRGRVARGCRQIPRFTLQKNTLFISCILCQVLDAINSDPRKTMLGNGWSPYIPRSGSGS